MQSIKDPNVHINFAAGNPEKQKAAEVRAGASRVFIPRVPGWDGLQQGGRRWIGGSVLH